MTAGVLSFVLFLAEAPPKPVAIVLDVQGQVHLERETSAARPLRRQELLRAGDRVRSVDGTAQIIWLGDGHIEVLLKAKFVTLGDKGCAPPDAVERREQKIADQNLNTLRDFAADGRLGALVAMQRRGGPPPRLVPISGAVVLNNRPILSWPAIADASGYRLTMMKEDGRALWTASTKSTTFVYMEKYPPLDYQADFRWRVESLLKDGSARQEFESFLSVPSKEKMGRLTPLQSVDPGASANDLLMAAWILDAERVYDAALSLYEKVAARTPDDAATQSRLAYLYTLAGRADKADKALDRALQLRKANSKD